jgi:HlyD family secretion protein
MQVKGGDVLFKLDDVPETAARDEAERRLVQARATLEDQKKGRRPSEIESLEARLAQARAALAFAQKEATRLEHLVGSDAVAMLEFERAVSTRDQAQQRVAQLDAELVTARLGARTDQISAAEANVRALEAALAAAEWNLTQKVQHAPRAGLVFDTLYREGEWVAAGRPVVALLPPAYVKLRAFVPEPRVATIQQGDPVSVFVDGVAAPLSGRVSYVSPRAEYTPPVIYSRESRSKLVFMVEAVFEPHVAAKLHPGQPVDVRFGSNGHRVPARRDERAEGSPMSQPLPDGRGSD